MAVSIVFDGAVLLCLNLVSLLAPSARWFGSAVSVGAEDLQKKKKGAVGRRGWARESRFEGSRGRGSGGPEDKGRWSNKERFSRAG